LEFSITHQHVKAKRPLVHRGTTYLKQKKNVDRN